MAQPIENSWERVLGLAESLDTPLTGKDYRKSREKLLIDYYGPRLLRPFAAPLTWGTRIAIWVEDGGPTVVHLPRVGQNGNLFLQHKLRSMHKGNELIDASHLPKQAGDKRITRVGQVIRKYSVDELLQLENVQDAEMSLVGPRPKPELEFRRLCKMNPAFESAYTRWLPGMTGLEQISGRAKLDDAARVDLTLQYDETACLELDIAILRQTVHAVATKDGAC